MIILLMEVSPFGLRKVGRAEDMDIPKEGVRTPYLKKIGSSNQDQTIKSLLGKEIIRLALPTPGKVCPESRYGLTMWKHLHR